MATDDALHNRVTYAIVALNVQVGNDMLAEEINRKPTDHGTGCGAPKKLCWQPVALADQLSGNRPVVPVHIFAEDLMMFCNGDGKIGSVKRHFSHRQVDTRLSYGRMFQTPFPDRDQMRGLSERGEGFGLSA